MNTEYSKVVNFEPEIEEEDVAIEEVTVPVTEHTFEVCDGFAVESLAALLPKSDKNIVELVLNSVYKQVESIDNLEALESYSAKFESIRNFFNAPVKNIKEISTTMEAGTEAYAAAMESELTQVAFIKNMLGIGEKESCSISDVRDCSDSLKKIGTLIESRRAALESVGDCGKKDVATEGKKDSNDNPPKEGIEDDRVMKPVDDDILTKKEFALAISMAQYFQNREEKGEKVPKLGKGVTWKDVVLGIHKGHYTVNALCDLGGGNIFCKGKDGKLAAVEGSDAKEMYMRAGKGIDGKNVFIVDNDDDLDENGKPKAGAMTKAYKLSKGTEAVEEDPGYLEAEAATCEEELVLDSEEEEDDEIESIAEYLASEAEESLGFFSDEEIEELNVALEAMLVNEFTPEEFAEYIAEEGMSDNIKKVADNIATKRYARKNKVSLNMAKVDRAFNALEKSLKSFEHPLQSNRYETIKKCFNIILAIGGATMIGVAGKAILDESSLIGDNVTLLGERSQKLDVVTAKLENDKREITSKISKLQEEYDEYQDKIKETIKKMNETDDNLEYNRLLNKIRAWEHNQSKIEGEMNGLKSAMSTESNITSFFSEEDIAEESTYATAANLGLKGISNILTKSGLGILLTIGAGVTGNIIINKLKNKADHNESLIKNTVDQYQEEYNKAKKYFDELSLLYKEIKKKGDPVDINKANEFIDKCKATTNIIGSSYKSLVNMMKQLIKSAKKNKTSITEEAKIQKKATEGLEIPNEFFDFEFEDITDDPDNAALEAYFNKINEFDNVAIYLAYESDISLEGLSDEELDELNDALEAYIEMDYTPEEFIKYLDEECASESVKEFGEKVANNIYAKTHGISVDMAKVERVYKALTKAYKAFEHPLKVPSAVYISKLLKGAMWVGLGGTIVAGTLGGTTGSLALLGIKMFNTAKTTMNNIKSSFKPMKDGKEGFEEFDETFEEAMEGKRNNVIHEPAMYTYDGDATLPKHYEGSRGGKHTYETEKAKGEARLADLEAHKPHPDTGGKSIAESESAKGLIRADEMDKASKAMAENIEKAHASVDAPADSAEDGKGGILEILKNATPATKALAALFVGGVTASIALKKHFKRKEDEEYIKRNLETYRTVYNSVTKDYEAITARYNNLKQGKGDINAFVKAANDMLRKMQAEYKRLNNILRQTMKQKDKYTSIEAGDARDGYDAATRKQLDDRIELNKDMNDITKKMDKAVPATSSFTKELESIRTDHFFDGEWINADEALKRFADVVEGMESALMATQELDDPDEVIQYLDWYDEQRSIIYAAIESLIPFLETVEEEPEIDNAMEALELLEADEELIAIEGRVDKKHPFAINLNSLEAQIANGMKAAATHLRKKNREEALDSLENATRACNEIIKNISSLSKDEFCQLTRNPKASDTTFKKFKEKKTMEFERTLKKIAQKRERINKKKEVSTESFVNEAYEKYLNSLGLNADGELLNEELEAMESYVDGLAEIAEADGDLDLALMQDDFVE